MNGAEDLNSVDNIDERPEECFQNWASGTKKIKFQAKAKEDANKYKKVEDGQAVSCIHRKMGNIPCVVCGKLSTRQRYGPYWTCNGCKAVFRRWVIKDQCQIR